MDWKIYILLLLLLFIINFKLNMSLSFFHFHTNDTIFLKIQNISSIAKHKHAFDLQNCSWRDFSLPLISLKFKNEEDVYMKWSLISMLLRKLSSGMATSEKLFSLLYFIPSMCGAHSVQLSSAYVHQQT